MVTSRVLTSMLTIVEPYDDQLAIALQLSNIRLTGLSCRHISSAHHRTDRRTDDLRRFGAHDTDREA